MNLKTLQKNLFYDLFSAYQQCGISKPFYKQNSFARRTGKGTLAAIKSFQKKVHSISQENIQPVYVLQMDIRSFFPFIHRSTLANLLTQQTSNLIERP